MKSKIKISIQIRKTFKGFSRRHTSENDYMLVYCVIYAFQTKFDKLFKSIINDVYLTIEFKIGSSIQFRVTSITDTEHM
jgi:hypothetical protein